MTKICKDGRPWGRNNSYGKLEYREKLREQKKGSKNPFWKEHVKLRLVEIEEYKQKVREVLTTQIEDEETLYECLKRLGL